MHGNNSSHHHDESASWPADLSLRAAQQRDKKAGNHRTVDSGLRREARGNRKGHGQRQGDQPNRYSGQQVMQEFVAGVPAQTKHRLRKPTFFEESKIHCIIIAATLPPAITMSDRWAIDCSCPITVNSGQTWWPRALTKGQTPIKARVTR